MVSSLRCELREKEYRVRQEVCQEFNEQLIEIEDNHRYSMYSSFPPFIPSHTHSLNHSLIHTLASTGKNWQISTHPYSTHNMYVYCNCFISPFAVVRWKSRPVRLRRCMRSEWLTSRSQWRSSSLGKDGGEMMMVSIYMYIYIARVLHNASVTLCTVNNVLILCDLTHYICM